MKAYGFTSLQDGFMSDEKEYPVIFGSIPPTLIMAFWDRLVPHLQKVVDVSHGEITLETTMYRALRGETNIVVISQGFEILAVTTAEIRIFDSGNKAMYIPIVGGECMDLWLDKGIDIMRQLARSLGCNEIRGFAARKGWMKILEPKGWKVIHEVISLPVED
jgi:hypothetical protein